MNVKTQHFVRIPVWKPLHYDQGKFVVKTHAWCEMAFKVMHFVLVRVRVCLVYECVFMEM